MDAPDRIVRYSNNTEERQETLPEIQNNALKSLNSGKSELYVDMKTSDLFVIKANGDVQSLSSIEKNSDEIAQKLLKRGDERKTKNRLESASILEKVGSLMKDPESKGVEKEWTIADNITRKFMIKYLLGNTALPEFGEAFQSAANRMREKIALLEYRANWDKKLDKKLVESLDMIKVRIGQDGSVSQTCQEIAARRNESLNGGQLGMDWMRYLAEDASTSIDGVNAPNWDASDARPEKQYLRTKDSLNAFMEKLEFNEEDKDAVIKSYDHFMQNIEKKSDSVFGERYGKFHNKLVEWAKTNDKYTHLARVMTLFSQAPITVGPQPLLAALKQAGIDYKVHWGAHIDIEVKDGVLTTTWKHSVMNFLNCSLQGGEPIKWQLRFDCIFSINLSDPDPKWAFDDENIKVGIPKSGADEKTAKKVFQTMKAMGYEPEIFFCPDKVVHAQHL